MTPAEAYEQFLVPAIFQPWAHAVLSAHPPRPGSCVLDVACGTGIGARLAAPIVGRSGRIAGLDSDEAALSVARASGRSVEGPPIDWHLASALKMPFGDRQFDYLLCLEGIQFFPDRSAALREMRRVLRPGGSLVASVWGPIEDNAPYHALAEGLRRFVAPDAARLPAFALTDGETIRGLMLDAGFDDVTVSRERLMFSAPSADAFVDWVAAGAPTTRHNLALIADDQREHFRHFVAARLAPYGTAEALVLPSTRHIVVAR